jgi:Fic family protein
MVNETPASQWQADRPWNDLPRLPPAVDIETKTVLKLVAPARAALGELKQAAFLIPNQSMLISILPLLEARASSEIENIVTTTDKLFRQVGYEENADPATKEALRYSRALFEGFQAINERPLNTGTAERICSTIKGVEMAVRKVPGTALKNSVTGATVYTPPEGEDRLRDLLANWERYMHEQRDLDPLIRFAVGHYQFEAIHPFTDGNGRTGRIINSLFLIQEGLLDLPILYWSRYVIANRPDYYRLLQAVTSQDAWEQWILYVVKGIEETAAWTTAKIVAIDALSRETARFVKERLPKIYSRELIELIFRLPYCRIGNLVEDGIAQRQTASSYLKQLVSIGVLAEAESGKEKLFLNPKLYDLLTSEGHEFKPYA